ncbi:UNVERIFIED_CONTAM: hypothetical protein GTU68_043631 [Idotea baltica]|nr:hypothetical protein [Idotea baltica]
MEIILRKDYPALGFTGDKVSVKSGYARNFLIPSGYGLEVSSKKAKELKHEVDAINAQKDKLKKEAEARAEEVSKLTITKKLKTAEQGKVYGSISPKEILAELAKNDFEISKKQLLFTEAIKSIGEFDISIKLHSEVTAAFKLIVEGEKAKVKKEAKEEKKAKSNDDLEETDTEVEVQDQADTEEE